MKKLSKLFATTLGLGLAVGVFAGLSNKKVESAKATASQSDIDEFTHNGQFAYQATIGSAVLMSAADVAAEGNIESGYDGAVLKHVGTNSAMKFDFTGSGIHISDINKINFKVYVYDPSSALTSINLRIRKSSTETTVLNKPQYTGFNLLTYRNTWVTYSLTASEFFTGYSFANIADANGYLTSFETFFRANGGESTVYFDSVDVFYYGDYSVTTISDIKTDFESPTTYEAATTYVILNNNTPFTHHSISVSFGINIPSGVGIQLDMAACKAWNQPYYSIRLNTAGSTGVVTTLRYNNAAVDTYYGATISLDTDHIITFRSVLLDSTNIALEYLIDNVSMYSYVTTYAAENVGHVLIFSIYENAAGVKIFDADVNATALSRFARRQLHTDTIPFSDRTEGNACRGESGYYAKASSFYTSFLTKNQKVEFATNASYAQERERMVAWAAANGTSISFNPTSGEITPSNARAIFAINETNKRLAITIIVSSLLATGAMLYFLLRKKKHQ